MRLKLFRKCLYKKRSNHSRNYHLVDTQTEVNIENENMKFFVNLFAVVVASAIAAPHQDGTIDSKYGSS